MNENNATSEQKILLEKITNNLASLPEYFQGVVYGMAMIITTPDATDAKKNTKADAENDI